MLIRSSPSTTQTKSVWAHTTTLWIISNQITNGKQLSEPHVYQGLPPTTQTTSVWVIWPKITTGKQLSKPYVYQYKTEPLRKNIKPLRENQQPPPHCGHTFSTTQPIRNFWHEIKTTMWSPCLWKTTFKALCLSGYYGHTQPLCGLFDLKTLLKNNF